MEIEIEFKACLYFFIILFFYSVYRIMQGSFQTNIIVMAEMIVTTYFMGYVQKLFLNNFDEGERWGSREAFDMLVCSAVYTGISYWLRWFDRSRTATLLYFFFMLCSYICAFLVYKIKRDFDTARLNKELEQFKKRKE